MTIKATETVPKAKVLYFFIKRFYTSISFSGTEKSFFFHYVKKRPCWTLILEKAVIFISENSFDPELTGKEEGMNKMYNT